MEITYLQHSGYLVTLPGCQLVFDYIGGPLTGLKTDNEVYFFVSHGHEDHYDRKIFQFRRPHRHWIISDDITDYPKRRKSLLVMGAGQVYGNHDLRITALPSTDVGVAFLVEIQGWRIFHAGDLNDWIWPSEEGKVNRAMEMAFISAMEPLKDLDIDVAFMPVDPRLKNEYYRGMAYLLKTAKVRNAFPMHFFTKPQIVRRYLKEQSIPPYTK